jgi:HD-like signal output (HDOD) protein
MTDTVDTQPAPSPVDALLESSLKDIGIPPRPAILQRISDEMLKDEPDFRRLANIIGADVSLAAGLIKTANSPFFGSRNRVRSVNEALVMLGLDVASRAIAGLILRKVFPASLHLERFWDASARIARLSGWLAKRVGHNKLRQDDAYTFGLFRDCGIPVLLMRFPGYNKVLAAANAEAAARALRPSRTRNCRPTMPWSAACWRRAGGCPRKPASPSATTTMLRSSKRHRSARR